MTDQTPIPTPTRHPTAWPVIDDPDTPPAARLEGWTPDKQRRFLEALGHGHTVVHACRVVGMSKQSAYALRRAPRGAAFALGWQAAMLLAREALADTLYDRAIDGVVETVTRPDGEVIERRRYDNRLALGILRRLDRHADAAAKEAGHAAARLVAADFEAFLDLVGRDAGPARAGLFVERRLLPAPEAAAEADLAPIRALARADRWLRARTGLAEEVDVSDLDPAARAGWTADQWARAEAAGLVRLAPPDPAPDSRDGTSQSGHALLTPEEVEAAGEPVWWCRYSDRLRTHFPPPDDFDGEEKANMSTTTIRAR